MTEWLSTNIYRPDAPGKFPVLLMRSPYGNGGAGNSEAAYMVETRICCCIAGYQRQK